MVSPQGKLSWWVVESRGKPIVVYLFCGRSREHIEKSLGVLKSKYKIRQASWSDVEGIIGCLIPSGEDSTDIATGSLLLQRNGNFVCIKYAG